MILSVMASEVARSAGLGRQIELPYHVRAETSFTSHAIEPGETPRSSMRKQESVLRRWNVTDTINFVATVALGRPYGDWKKMERNPIVKICADYMAVGKTIREVRPGNRIEPKKSITIVFTDGRQTPHEIEAMDRDQFLLWSKEATKYLHDNAV